MEAFVNPSSVGEEDLQWVASLQVSNGFSEESILEKCYFLTQNLEKMWVMNPQVSALAEGEEGGLRSSVVGDVFVYSGSAYAVDLAGFRKVDALDGLQNGP